MRLRPDFLLTCELNSELKNLSSAIFKSITDEMIALKANTNQELRKAAEQMSALSDKTDKGIENLSKESSGMVENLRFESEKRFDGLRQAMVNFGENLRAFGERFDEQTSALSSKVTQLQKTVLQDAKKRELELRLLIEENKEKTEKQLKLMDQKVEGGIEAQTASLNQLSQRFGQAMNLQIENENAKLQQLADAIQEQESRFSALEDRFSQESADLVKQLLNTSESCLIALGKLNQKMVAAVAGSQAEIQAQLESSVLAAQAAITDLHEKIDQTGNRSQKTCDQLNKAIFESAESLTLQFTNGLADLENRVTGVVDALSENSANMNKRLEDKIEKSIAPCVSGLGRQEEASAALEKRFDELVLKVNNLAEVSFPLMETKESVNAQIVSLSGRIDEKMAVLSRGIKEAQTRGEENSAVIEAVKTDFENTKRAVSGLEISFENLETNVTEATNDCKGLLKEVDKLKGQVDRLDGSTDLNLGELKEELQKAKGEMLQHLQAITESVNERDVSTSGFQEVMEQRLKNCEDGLQAVKEQVKQPKELSTVGKEQEKKASRESIERAQKEADINSKVAKLEQTTEALQKEFTLLALHTKPLINNGQKEIIDGLVRQVSTLEKKASSELGVNSKTPDIQAINNAEPTAVIPSVKTELSEMKEELLLQINDLRQNQQNNAQAIAKNDEFIKNAKFEHRIERLNQLMDACHDVISQQNKDIAQAKSDILGIEQKLENYFERNNSTQNLQNNNADGAVSSSQSLTKSQKQESQKSADFQREINGSALQSQPTNLQQLSEIVDKMQADRDGIEERFKTQNEQLMTLASEFLKLQSEHKDAFAAFKAEIDKNVNKKMMSHRDDLHSEISENMQYLVDEAIAELSKTHLESEKSLDKRKIPSVLGVIEQPEQRKSRQSKHSLNETSDTKVEQISAKLTDLEHKYTQLANMIAEQKNNSQTAKGSKTAIGQSKEPSKTSMNNENQKISKQASQTPKSNETSAVDSVAKKLDDFKAEVSIIIKVLNMKISELTGVRNRFKDDRLAEKSSSANAAEVRSLNRFNSDEITEGNNNLLQYDSNEIIGANNGDAEALKQKNTVDVALRERLEKEPEATDWSDDKAARHMSSMFLEKISPWEALARNVAENDKESMKLMQKAENPEGQMPSVLSHLMGGPSKYGMQEIKKELITNVEIMDKKMADLNAQITKMTQQLTKEVDSQVTAKIAVLRHEILASAPKKPTDRRTSQGKRNSQEAKSNSSPGQPGYVPEPQINSDPFITLKRTEQLIDDQIRKRLQNFKSEIEAKIERLRSEVALSASSSSISKTETAKKLSTIIRASQIGEALLNSDADQVKLAKTSQNLFKKMSALEAKIDEKMKAFENEVRRFEEAKENIIKGVDTENNRMRMFVQNENVNLMEKVENAIKRHSIQPSVKEE